MESYRTFTIIKNTLRKLGRVTSLDIIQELEEYISIFQRKEN
jgi:hypothetical protein